MVLRITRNDAATPSVLLRLDGRLVGAFAALLEHECAVLSRALGSVAIDLSGVVVVDRLGVEALQRLHRTGVAIRGCSELIASILAAEGIRVDRD
jgi:anti-anti-sigma regulatory factor